MTDPVLTLPAWTGACRYDESYFWVDRHDALGRAQSSFEFVPLHAYLFVLSSLRFLPNTDASLKTTYRARFRWADGRWTDVASNEWPWDQLSAYPSAHPLKSAFWLDQARSCASAVEKKQESVLTRFAAGELSEDYVHGLSGGKL